VATVNAKGKIVAKGVGKATITVKATGANKATIQVKVVSAAAAKKAAKVESVALKGVKGTMTVGETQWAGATFTPLAPGAAVTYRSSDPNVLSVDKAGRVTAKAPGNATLTVKAGGKSAKATVTVQ
jgi:hypothetical protein